MSCEVKTFGKIPDLKQVQELLGFSQDDSWLNAVYFSISPTAEVIAIGHGSKLFIFCLNFTRSNQIPTYALTWKGEVDNPNDVITAILCLPIYGPNVNSGADWTCIAVGLASGLVLFYADTGVQIFSQKWHPEQVQTIKAQTVKHYVEEVHIGYGSCICIIQSSILIQVLKGLKNKFSKNLTSNSSDSRSSVQQFTETVSCRKWEYRGRQTIVNDSVVVGAQASSAFDHLLEQSLEGGFYKKSKSTIPQKTLIIEAGVKPYIGFQYAKEGFSTPDLGDVAKAVASKLVSSLPNWLFKSTNQPQSPEQVQQVQPADPLQCRFGLCDIQRQGLNVYLAPGRQLAAVTDNLSRIVLIDCNRGVALKIWKGYRDAQCSFIKVSEKKSSGTDKSTDRRKSIFLVIFAPRRSCLEIWALEHGPKVAAFTANKNGQLVYNDYGLLGVTPGSRAKYSLNSCLFVDPSDDTLKEIQVPFHCALSGENSITAKDVHLLRRIKMCLRGEFNTEEVLTEIELACSSFQTNEIRAQCLDMLTKKNKVTSTIFKKVIDILQSQILASNLNSEQSSNDVYIDHKRQSLDILVENYKRLVEFYIAVKAPNEENNTTVHNRECLCLSENDLETIQKLLDLSIHEQNNAHNSPKVTFEKQEDDFVDFINIFNVETEEIKLKRDKIECYSNIGSMLFGRFLEKGHPISNFINSSSSAGISSEDFLDLILHYWLGKPFFYTKSEEVIEDMTRLATIIQHICDLAADRVNYSYNTLSPWWQRIRELLLESPSALRGLLTAIVCRNLSGVYRKKDDSTDDTSTSTDEEVWEEVSQEAAQWTLLITRLDDISILGAILHYPQKCLETKLPSLSYDKPDVSLKAIILGGKGIIPELVAKWLGHSGIDPKLILEKLPPITSSENIEKDNQNEEPVIEPVLKHLQILREHFPFSLESGIILCHMAWEYMSHWSKNLSNMEYLNAGLICLDTFRTEDFALKHGICCMIWNAHLKIPMEATKKLINKAGKLPKEKFCQQDIGISDSLVPELLDYCLTFFQHFSSSLEYEKRELKFEENLQDGLVPLSQLSLQQNHAIIEILNLHTELCRVLHLIAFFSIKVTRPVQSLFSEMDNITLFVEINRELPYTLPKADMILERRRQEFLFRAISASMDSIREDLERLYVLEHDAYMKRIEQLADLWGLDKVALRKHQVVEMYAHGWDVYAEELLSSIIDFHDLGTSLLEIAGKRLNIISDRSVKNFSHIASAGPILTTYLSTLKKDTNGRQIFVNPEDVQLREVSELTAKAFHCLSNNSTKDSRQLRIAGLMYDACQYLKQLELEEQPQSQ